MTMFPERYASRALLGRGGMGEVWRVFDRERGEEVALKLCTAAGERARFLFGQEFWSMAALPHPRLVAAYDFGEGPAGPYFTMALVEGRDLAELLPQGEAAVARWLPDVLAALGALHATGCLHGDLKPENIRIGAGATLMDLGLLGRSGQPAGEVRGTLAYMPPEALQGGVLDARSDLYALGAVLYHVLSGAPPFTAPDALGLLQAHMRVRPAPLEGVSPAWAAAIARLLAKDPAHRAADVAALARELGLAGLDGAASRGLLAAPLVGREAWLEQLDAAAGRVWWQGPAASGKTRLLGAAKARAQLADVQTLAARGLGADAGPYQALAPWLRAIVARRPASLAAHATLLARVLPELGAPAPVVDAAAERTRLRDAVLALAQEAFPGPTLWLLDDAEALDAPSRDMAIALAKADRPWVHVVTSTEAAPEGAVAMSLTPLADVDVLAIASTMLAAPPPSEVTQRLPLAAGGQPGRVGPILAHWIAAGDLARGAAGWEARPAATFALPPGLPALDDPRLAALGEPARAVLAAAALVATAAPLTAPHSLDAGAGAAASLPGSGEGASAEGDLALVAALVDVPEAAFFPALARVEAAGLLVTEAGRFRFVAQGHAALLATAIPAARAQAWHTRAATWLASGDPATAPLATALAIARHHLAGMTPGAGIPWALAAARRALALDAAAQAGRLAAAALAVPDLPADDRLQLQGLLVYARRFAGDVDGAMAIYEGGLLQGLEARGDAVWLEHLVTWGTLLQARGRYAEAREAFARAAAGDAVAPLQGVRARLFAARVAFFAGEAEPARAHAADAIARARALAQNDQAALPLLGRAMSFGGLLEAGRPGGEDAGLALLEEAIALHERTGDARELQEACNNMGNVLMGLGRAAEAADVYERALALCRRLGMEAETIFALLGVGAARLDLGDAPAAVHAASNALALARAQARRFPEGYALALEGLAMVLAGDAEGLARIEQGQAIAVDLGNRYLELNVRVYEARALAALGRVAPARAAVEAARALARATANQEFDARLNALDDALVHAASSPGGVPPARLQAWLNPLARLTTAPTEAEAVRAALAGLVAAVGAERGFVVFYDAFDVVGRASYRLDGEDSPEDEDFSTTIAEQVLWSGQPAWIEDAGTDADLAGSASVAALALRAVVGLPLVAQGRTLGVLLADSRKLGLPPAEERELALAFARTAALAIARARQAEADAALLAHHARERRLGLALAAETAFDAAAALVLQEALALVGAERGFVLQDVGDAPPRVLASCDAQGQRLPAGEEPSQTVCRWVFAQRRATHLLDLANEAELAGARSVLALGLRTAYGAPVLHGERCLAMLYLDARRASTPAAGELAALTDLAAWLGAFMTRGQRREGVEETSDG